MTDIVERLRCKAESPNLFDLLAEAAEEIGRLRAKVAALENASGLTKVGQERGNYPWSPESYDDGFADGFADGLWEAARVRVIDNLPSPLREQIAAAIRALKDKP